MAATRSGTVRAMRPLPGDARPWQQRPDWIRRARARPLLYATLGTFFNEPAVFAILIAALNDFPGTAVVTIGSDRNPADLPRKAITSESSATCRSHWSCPIARP